MCAFFLLRSILSLWLSLSLSLSTYSSNASSSPSMGSNALGECGPCTLTIAGLCCAGERPARTQHREGEAQSQCRSCPSDPPDIKYGDEPSLWPASTAPIDGSQLEEQGGLASKLLIAWRTGACGWLGKVTAMRRGTSLPRPLSLLRATGTARKHLMLSPPFRIGKVHTETSLHPAAMTRNSPPLPAASRPCGSSRRGKDSLGPRLSPPSISRVSYTSSSSPSKPEDGMGDHALPPRPSKAECDCRYDIWCMGALDECRHAAVITSYLVSHMSTYPVEVPTMIQLLV